jgi:hypothetical protein
MSPFAKAMPASISFNVCPAWSIVIARLLGSSPAAFNPATNPACVPELPFGRTIRAKRSPAASSCAMISSADRIVKTAERRRTARPNDIGATPGREEQSGPPVCDGQRIDIGHSSQHGCAE